VLGGKPVLLNLTKIGNNEKNHIYVFPKRNKDPYWEIIRSPLAQASLSQPATSRPTHFEPDRDPLLELEFALTGFEISIGRSARLGPSQKLGTTPRARARAPARTASILHWIFEPISEFLVMRWWRSLEPGLGWAPATREKRERARCEGEER
jgi:hypothetical protein